MKDIKKQSNTITIMRKEFSRFFHDRRLVMSALVLPGLMIYILYSLIGSAMQSAFTVDDSYAPEVYAQDMPASVGDWLAESGVSFEAVPSGQTERQESVKQDIRSQNADLLLIFPANFETTIAERDVRSGTAAPNIEVFWNSASTTSSEAYSRVTSALSAYEETLVNVFDVNVGDDEAAVGATHDLATAADSTGRAMSTLLPMLLLVFMFSGCLSIAPESIAGEKDRGTIATLLVTPMHRSELAVGKILSLCALGFLCGLSSAVGTMFSIQRIMGGAESVNISIYGVSEYAMLAFVILSTVLVIVSVIAVLSAFAKSVKEASLIATPFMLIVMLVGVTAMFGGGTNADAVYYLIPLYNSVQCMVGIFTFDYSAVNVAITLASNVAVACICGFALTRMFGSEKIMFNR